jgi:hypothetical protein
MHVVSLCFKCFRCFRRMLHIFHLVVSKVDLGVAHCCKWHTCIFQSHVPSLSYVFRSSVAHAAIEPVARRASPCPLLSSPTLCSLAPSRCGSSSSADKCARSHGRRVGAAVGIWGGQASAAACAQETGKERASGWGLVSGRQGASHTALIGAP